MWLDEVESLMYLGEVRSVGVIRWDSKFDMIRWGWNLYVIKCSKKFDVINWGRKLDGIR